MIIGQFVRRNILTFGAAVIVIGCTEAPQPRGEPWKEFSGQNALQHVQRLVDLGPRPPASEAIEKSRAYITKELESSGWQVTRQEFTFAGSSGYRNRDRSTVPAMAA